MVEEKEIMIELDECCMKDAFTVEHNEVALRQWRPEMSHKVYCKQRQAS